MSGSVELVNYDSEVNNAFDWGFRLEILGYGFDEKLPGNGNIKDNGNTFNRSETISLHVDRTHALRDERHTMRGTVWLNVEHPRRWNQTDAWQANFDVKFLHTPHAIVGLGPTKNGVDFVDNARGFYAAPGDTRDSLLITDAPYSQVYWYVRAPNDTTYGTNVEVDGGDGKTSKATMRYTFPEDVEGTYKIIAYIYRWDLSVYELSYSVWVSDFR